MRMSATPCILIASPIRAAQHAPCCPLLPPQVGRVKTEHTVLQAVDHPFLAKMYATLQTGEGEAAATTGRLLSAPT